MPYDTDAWSQNCFARRERAWTKVFKMFPNHRGRKTQSALFIEPYRGVGYSQGFSEELFL